MKTVILAFCSIFINSTQLASATEVVLEDTTQRGTTATANHQIKYLVINGITIIPTSSEEPIDQTAADGSQELSIRSIENPETRGALDFGTGSPGTSAKTVFAQSPSAATFAITGAPSAAVVVTVPGTATYITGPGSAISVSGFTTTSNVTLSAAGKANISVGATVGALPAGQVAGNYTGSFSVTVSYK